MRRLRLTQNPRHQAPADLLSLGILGLLLGLIDLGMILPVYAGEKNSRLAKPEGSDPANLLKELERTRLYVHNSS